MKLLSDYGDGSVIIGEIIAPKPAFALGLHKKLQEVIKKNTGKVQAIVNVQNSKYYFLCGARDLEETLARWRKKYPELWNEDKIDNVLTKFVDRCSRTGNYAMLVQYYILHKERGSAMSTAIESVDDMDSKEKVAPIETKNLF